MSNKTRTRTTRTTSTTGAARTLRPVPDQTTAPAGRTATEDKLWKALHANPNSTAVDLSVAAKIGKSTAGKILAKWHKDGSVTRTAGIAHGGRRAADLWTIADPNAAPPTDDTADDTTDDQADDAPQGAVKAQAGNPAEAEHAEAEATTTPTNDGAATEVDNATEVGGDGKAERLPPGALRGMVEDFLRDHPGEEFGPAAVAKALGGKSSGAVSNVLDKLVENKTAVKTRDKPKRFALAPAEADPARART